MLKNRNHRLEIELLSRPSRIKTLDIVYVGPSLNNCPRLKLIIESCSELSLRPYIWGVTKVNNHQSNYHDKFERCYGNGSPLRKKINVCVAFAHVAIRVFISRPKQVYCINPLAGLIGVLCKFFWNTQLFYETQEIFAGVRYQGVGSKLLKLLVFIDRKAASFSSVFITTDQFRVKFIRRLYRLPRATGIHIYNVSRNDDGPDQISSEIISELRRKFDKIALYAGGVSADRGVDELLKIAAEFRNSEFAFLIAGKTDSSIKEEIFAEAAQQNVFRIQDPSHDQLKALMREADVSFAFYRPTNLNNRFSSPNKVFDALEICKPVITTESPLTRYIAKKTQLCNLVNWNTSEQLITDSIMRLRSLKLARFDGNTSEFTYNSEKFRFIEVLRKASAAL